MAAIEKLPSNYAHGDGHADIAWDPTVTEYPGQFITCGGDGEVRIWNGLEDDSPVAISLAGIARGLASRPIIVEDEATDAETAVEAPPRRSRFVVGSGDTQGVHAYDLPDARPDGILTRFTADVTCLSYSPNGVLLAAGAGDFLIKILRECGNGTEAVAPATTLSGHSAPVLSLAFDPAGTRLASAACNGEIKIWDLIDLASGADASSDSTASRCVKSLGGVFPASNDFDNTQTLCRLCWSPDGSSLLVPAVGGVKSFNSDSWDFQFTFTEESLTVANVCCFSPCGKYLAVASTNGFLIIFDYAARICVTKTETDKGLSLCSMLWNLTVPIGKPKELVACDVDGNLCGFKCRLSVPAPARKKASSSKAQGVENFQGLFDDDDGDFTDAASQQPMDGDDDGADEADDGVLDFGAGDEDGGTGVAPPVRADGAGSRADSMATPTPKHYGGVQLPSPQESFQPSATPRHLSNRFMVWNSMGIVTQLKNENSIDVEFHDTSVHHAIHLANDDDFVMADLNHNLVALASEGEEGEGGSPSKLMVLTISSWDSTKQWTASLPEGEVAEAIAVGGDWVAVATSKRMLRIFSAGGLQREILSLPGPVVCMSGFESQLLVALHDGVGVDGDQKMALMHFRNLGGRPYGFKKTRYPLVVTAKATLEWLGFSFEGSPVAVDSEGVVRMTKRRFQNEWVQIADARKNLGKSDHYFIIAVSERDAHLRCIFCKGCSYPAVLPKPLVQTLPIALPVVEPESDKSIAESAFWAAASLEENEETAINMQEQLLKLMALSCKTDRDFRAVEVASLFPSAESLQLAIKYASRLKKMNLATKFGEIALRRRQEEEEETAAAARGRGRVIQDEEDFEDERPPDSQMSLFDDSPPSAFAKTKSAIRLNSRNGQRGDKEEEAVEMEEADEEEEEESGPLLQLGAKKSQKPLTPLVATASPANTSATSKFNGNNPFKKQASFDVGAAESGKNVFASLAQPPAASLKRASSFNAAAAGGRFSKAAGSKKAGGSDVIKPPPVKKKTTKTTSSASMAKAFETQQKLHRQRSAEEPSKVDSIVTSTPLIESNVSSSTGNTTSSSLDDESPFAFWKRCNLDSIMAEYDEEVDDVETPRDDDALTQHCVKKFRELPTAERKEWIAKFNSQKQTSQKGSAAADAAAVAENTKKRKLDAEEGDEDKEQKPPSAKSKLAAFAFAGGD